MNTNQDQFESLRRALALKRHEQPPPRFFNDFSSQVIGRIRAGDRGEAAGSEQWFWEVPWLQRFWAALEAKPALSGGFAVAVCGMLVAGVVYSEKADPAAARFGEIAPESPSTMMAIADGANQGAGLLVDQSALTPGTEPNPLVITQPRGSIFSDLQHRSQVQPQLINFSPSGN